MERPRVYPRPHGEAASSTSGARGLPGLSPPTRGSPAPGLVGEREVGSIPAHTGKPTGWTTLYAGATVYPRPHGEASDCGEVVTTNRGLSPPTRGSPAPGLVGEREVGSIPAHTGKPTGWTTLYAGATVYPRPHGEASFSASAGRWASGLSPPTRGSPFRALALVSKLRSIPAHTGKPSRGAPWRRAPEVYPRPHGEAALDGQSYRNPAGLSPPTRGSLGRRPSTRARVRSIPAHTGKPDPRVQRQVSHWVYPRPHGEAFHAFRRTVN